LQSLQSIPLSDIIGLSRLLSFNQWWRKQLFLLLLLWTEYVSTAITWQGCCCCCCPGSGTCSGRRKEGRAEGGREEHNHNLHFAIKTVAKSIAFRCYRDFQISTRAKVARLQMALDRVTCRSYTPLNREEEKKITRQRGISRESKNENVNDVNNEAHFSVSFSSVSLLSSSPPLRPPLPPRPPPAGLANGGGDDGNR
jgi:hypothetical protein